MPQLQDDTALPEVPTYGEKNRKLPGQLKRSMDGIVQRLQEREVFDRRIEVLKDRMHRFYDDGIQYFYPNYGTGAYQIGTPGAILNVGNQTIECPDYIGSYNIFYPFGRSLDAVLTQNPPGIDFQPDDPSRSEDMEAAQTAEGYRHYFDQANDVNGIQQKISRMFRLSGRTVLWTRTQSDEQLWGLNDDGEPRSMEVTTVHGTLESKVPILAKSQKECSFIVLYDDPDVLMMKSQYDWIADKIKGGQGALGENEWERFARIGVLQARKGYFLTGNSGINITTRMNLFLRPEVFSSEEFDEIYLSTTDDKVPNDNDDGSQMTLRDKFNQLFPEGAHVVYIGQNYAEATNESLDDHIVIGFPKERDGMSGGALVSDLVVIQDEFNDLKNAERTAYENGWPSTWVSADDIEYDALMDQKSEPFAFRQFKGTTANMPLEQKFFREPDMQLPQSFVACIQDLMGPLGQFITGALPALQGQNDPDNKTASGKAMDRNQAMGMLGMPWASMQRMFSRMYYQAALLAAKNPDHAKGIIIPGNGDGANVTLRLERLTKGKFHSHPDIDSSFPESTAAKRANLQQIVQLAGSSPLGQTFFESPDNWEQIYTLMGFPQLKLVPAIAYRKQVREIELLLRESPVPPTKQEMQPLLEQHAQATILAMQSGQPAPPPPNPQALMKPSIPALADDYHQWESAKCKEYLSSEECWRELAEGNGQGIENVRLHKAMHDAFLAQAAAAQQQQQKPPAESINFKDLPPQGQVQEAAQAGIKIAPSAMAPETTKSVQKQAAAPGSPGTATT